MPYNIYWLFINAASLKQSTEFLCDGKFLGIQTENTSCSNCSKKLQQCFRPSHALHVMIQSLWGSSFQVTNIYIQFIQSNLLLSYTKLWRRNLICPKELLIRFLLLTYILYIFECLLFSKCFVQFILKILFASETPKNNDTSIYRLLWNKNKTFSI